MHATLNEQEFRTRSLMDAIETTKKLLNGVNMETLESLGYNVILSSINLANNVITNVIWQQTLNEVQDKKDEER